jgi:hypothetical protein
LPIQSERGYLIPAINSENVDYRRCADMLVKSLLDWHPNADITVVTRDMLPDPSVQGWAVDAQMFQISPYRETIKLEADMLVCSPIDHWWTLFEKRDVVVSQGCRDFYDQPSTSRYYRKVFYDNNLPDVYNAVTYWRLSRTAQEFFRWVGRIFLDWNQWRTLLKFPDEYPSTDLVYAIAALIIGPEKVTLPSGVGINIVHMKHRIIPTHVADWTQELVWEYIGRQLKINTVSQHGLFHYHIKDWIPHG